MNIVMITGSPHKNGTSALLAEQFTQGARSAGHTIIRFDAAFVDLHPCRACDYCVTNNGVCVQKDAMETMRSAILSADLIALVTPTYYFGMSAQLKMVIDRFYAFNDALLEHPKKSILLATCGDTEEWVPAALEAHYQTICHYLGWKNVGTVFARGVYRLADIENTKWPQQARALGAAL